MTNTPTRPETMVERVAGAIEMLSLEYALRRLEGMEDSDPGQGIWEEFARAAIEAMREPDFLMKMAGASAITVEIMEAKANYDGACDAWQAMITAALGEGK